LSQTWHAFALKPQEILERLKVYRFRIPVKKVSVARKVSTIEEWRHDQNCLFRRGDYRGKCNNTENTVLGSSPGEDGRIVKLTRINTADTQLVFIKILLNHLFYSDKVMVVL
jgi:hypothetical protein